MELKGQGALVTGASSGIGREIARALAARGARVAIAARREPLLEELADEIAASGAERPAVLPADLSQRGAAADLAERATAALGRVDVLVNNAGVGIGGTQWRVGDRDEGRELFETNFWSPLALTAALVPAMRERDGGAVVNVSSVSQVAPWPLMGHYSASKAAIGSASETLRLELANSRVHVLEVVAGPNDTAVQAEAQELPGFADAIKGGGMGRPERLAALVVRALERERPRIVYPRRAGVGYWFPPLLRAVLPRMARRVPEAADDPRVVRGGSQGDAESLEARAEWERAHRG